MSEWIHDSVAEWMDQARRAIELDDARTAAWAAEEARLRGAGSADVMGILARANVLLGRCDEAISQAQWASEHEPDNLFHQYTLALAFTGAGASAQALGCWEQLARRDRESVQPQRGIASVHRFAGAHDRAAAILEDLHRKDPYDEEIANELAEALIEMARDVPRVRGGGRFTVTSPEEIRRMRQLLSKAMEVACTPRDRRVAGRLLEHIQEVAEPKLVPRRLYGTWARRYALIAVVLVLIGAFTGELVEVAALFILAGATAVVMFAFVPDWEFNRANATGRVLRD